jgi:hypothetical protein
MRRFGQTPFRTCLLLALTSILAACGGGGGGEGSYASPPVSSSPPPQPAPSPSPPQPGPDDSAITATLSGSVGDGPVVGSALSFFDREGVDLASYSSGSNADYQLSLRLQPEQFPLTIEAHGGTDLVSGVEPDFSLLTVVLEPGKQLTANLNPFSTLIVQTARYLRGGPSPNNIASARTSVLGHFGFGLDRRIVPDPLQTQIDATNVAVMVKSSEAAGETIRRVRDTLLGTGVQSADEVMEALAADLIDGIVDGRGAGGSNPRIAAVTTIVSAQVLIESLKNELRVNGVSATAAMDNAITAIRPGVPAAALTASVPNNRQALVQAALAISAAAEISPDPSLNATASAIARLADDSPPTAARVVIPGGVTVALQRALDRVTYSSDAEISRVNARTRRGWEQPPTPIANYRLGIAEVEVVEGEPINFTIGRDIDAGEEYVILRTKDGSATGYDDYEYNHATTVRFGEGELSREVAIDTYDDGQVEGEETFEILLTEALGGGRITSLSTLTVTLRDGEGAPPPIDPPPPAPSYVAPTLESATVRDGQYTLAWRHPREFLDGGFDVIVDGESTGIDDRTTELKTTVGPLDSSVARCFQVEARYVKDNRYPRSNTLCVDAEPAPGGDRFVAPVLDSVIADDETYRLSWTHPGPDDGFDIVIDGENSGEAHRTSALAATISPLDPHVRHCFAVTARYPEAGKFPSSGTVCADAQPDTNRPPTISGRPAGIAVVGEPWSFQPEATDPDGGRLSFSISNQPAWANFDPATGRLSGAPAPGSEGRYGNIVISVSDGEASASLAAFEIEVRAAPKTTGSVTLAWTPPTKRADGTPLDRLTGYRVYKGTGAGELTLTATLDNPGLASFVVEGLAAGPWTFAVTAIDGLGQESSFSNHVSVVID